MTDHRSEGSAYESSGRKGGSKLWPALATFLVVGFSVYASLQAVPPGAQPGQPAATGDAESDAAKAVAAANAFLETLDAQQRAKALLEYDSGKKPGWSNLPVTMVPRNGVRRAAALEAVAAVLSKQGYQKVIDIM